MFEEILKDAENRMIKAIEAMERNFATIRTGRANPSVLDKVMVSYYGNPTPLNQLATIAVPEAKQLLIKPFDKSVLKDMERAINEANLGLTPNNDGETIRIIIPALNEERRKDLTKQAKAISEEGKVGLRNARHEALTKLKNADLTEDIQKNGSKQVQDLINKYNKVIDEKLSNKNSSILEV